MRNLQLFMAAAELASLNVLSDGKGIEPQQAFRIPRIQKSKRYPEQSSRQIMRQFRRQQGGQGIVLNTGTWQYEPV